MAYFFIVLKLFEATKQVCKQNFRQNKNANTLKAFFLK